MGQTDNKNGQCFPFSALPAEIRIMIYEFALEVPTARILPKQSSKLRKKPHLFKELRGTALLQANHAIRQEFRPIWLRNAEFKLRGSYLSRFLRLFYPTADDYRNSPKEITIYCVNDEPQTEVDDLLPLLYMRSIRTSVRFDPMLVLGLNSSYHGMFVFDRFRALNKLFALDNATWITDLQERRIEKVKAVRKGLPGGFDTITQIQIAFSRSCAPEYEDGVGIEYGDTRYLADTGLISCVDQDCEVSLEVGRNRWDSQDFTRRYWDWHCCD